MTPSPHSSPSQPALVSLEDLEDQALSLLASWLSLAVQHQQRASRRKAARVRLLSRFVRRAIRLALWCHAPQWLLGYLFSWSSSLRCQQLLLKQQRGRNWLALAESTQPNRGPRRTQKGQAVRRKNRTGARQGGKPRHA